ncbi:MAG: hypothetical protein HZB16_24400 [Armatimonadetes bacterium]|nr:hypothetical protein [Armatimonadota bacterium]
MTESAGHPLLALIESALAPLGARPMGATDEALLVAYAELEMELVWTDLDACLHGTDPAHWADAVAERVVHLAAEARTDTAEPADALATLLPVLWGESSARDLARRAPDVLAFSQAPGLITTLAAPTVNGRRFVQRAELESLGQPAPALVAAALGNLRARTGEDAVQMLRGDEAGLSYGLACDDGLDSSRLLILPDLLPQFAEQGLVAAIPARDFLVAAPFCRPGLAALRGLAQVAHDGARTMPQPVSGDLYWISRSGTARIGVSPAADGRPHLDLPQSLAEHQAQLAARGLW